MMYCKWEKNRWKKLHFIPQNEKGTWEDLVALGYRKFEIVKEDLNDNQIHDNGQYIEGGDTVTYKFSAIDKPEKTESEIKAEKEAKKQRIKGLIKHITALSSLHVNTGKETLCKNIVSNLRLMYENFDQLSNNNTLGCLSFLKDLSNYLDDIILEQPSASISEFSACENLNEIISFFEMD